MVDKEYNLIKRLINISNVLAVCSILFAFIKVKSLATLLPLAESDKIFYWTYLFLIIPNLLSFGLSIEVYKIYLEHKELAFNKLVHKFILLVILGSIITAVVLYYLNLVPLFSLLGLMALLIIIINIPIGTSDTLIGLIQGPKKQQILNILRSNLWVMVLILLVLANKNFEKQNITLFFCSYFTSQLIILFIYKKSLGKIGRLHLEEFKDLILQLKTPNSYIYAFNNILIQNKDYILGFCIRTFLISRVNIPGLVVLFSVFDILITIVTSVINNEFLKNYGKELSNSKNVAWIKLLISLTIIPLIIINIFKGDFVFLLVGNKTQNLDGYILYFSIYTFLRIIFISLNQLILLDGKKMAIWMSAFLFFYFFTLLNIIPISWCISYILILLILDLIFVYYTFKKLMKHEYS